MRQGHPPVDDGIHPVLALRRAPREDVAGSAVVSAAQGRVFKPILLGRFHPDRPVAVNTFETPGGSYRLRRASQLTPGLPQTSGKGGMRENRAYRQSHHTGNAEGRMQNAEWPREATSCDIKATSKRVASRAVATPMRHQSHLHATSKPPQCDPHATLMRPSCDPHATHMRPSCDPHATLMRPSCDPHATPMRP